MSELSAAPVLIAPSDVDPPEDAFDDGDGEPIHWVTAAHFFNVEDAHIARLRLISQEIPCFIADEHMIGTAWHYAIALGGAKLKVPVEWAKDAADTLAGTRASAAGELVNHAGVCPRCGSADIRKGRIVRRLLCLLLLGPMVAVHPLAIVALLAGGITYLLTSRTSACEECGYEWKGKPARGFDVIASTPLSGPPASRVIPDEDPPK